MVCCRLSGSLSFAEEALIGNRIFLLVVGDVEVFLTSTNDRFRQIEIKTSHGEDMLNACQPKYGL